MALYKLFIRKPYLQYASGCLLIHNLYSHHFHSPWGSEYFHWMEWNITLLFS